MGRYDTLNDLIETYICVLSSHKFEIGVSLTPTHFLVPLETRHTLNYIITRLHVKACSVNQSTVAFINTYEAPYF